MLFQPESLPPVFTAILTGLTCKDAKKSLFKVIILMSEITRHTLIAQP